MSDENREQPRLTRAALARLDWENQFLQPAFRRIVFTIFETSGIFTGNFHSDGRIHAMSEGRRSLGLDILRTAETYLGPGALSLILAEEIEAQKGSVPNAKSEYADKRRAELGGNVELRDPGTGLVFLDYADPGGTSGGSTDASAGS